MAGVLLLISKKKTNKKLIVNLTKRLDKFIHTSFGDYFQSSVIKTLSDQVCLAEFRNQNAGQYYYDPLGNWLSFEGVVFDLNCTSRLDAKAILELYQKHSEEFINQLDGHFVIKLYNSRTNQILVCNDFIKNKTNFITENDNFILFTPYLVTVGLLQKVELDLHAFNEFMWRYYILSERTMIRNVRRLSPGTIYIYDLQSEKLKEKKYWGWPQKFTQLSFDNSVEKTVSSMRETALLINQSFQKPCIDFTMGQDSRQVIASYTNQNLPFSTAIFGKSDFYEAKKVSELARKYQIEHHNVQLDSRYLDNLSSHFQKAIILGSCEQPGYMLSRILFMRSQYSQWGNVSINGIDGHFYKNGLWDEQYTLNLYREPKAFNIDLFLKLRVLSNKYPDEIFNESFKKIKVNSKNYFCELISQSIKTHLESPISIQFDKFDLHHWLNFGIAGNSTSMSLLPHISPLLLRRNLEFALTIPVQWKFNLSKYQRAVVYTLDPQLAAEKTDFGGVNMIPKNALTFSPFFLRYAWFQTGRMRNKIKNLLGFPTKTHIMEAWDYLPIYQKQFDDPVIEGILDFDKMYLADIIEKQAWSKLIHKSQKNENVTLNEYEFLLKLASVELFLQMCNKI